MLAMNKTLRTADDVVAYAMRGVDLTLVILVALTLQRALHPCKSRRLETRVCSP